MSRPLVIVGCGGFGREVFGIAHAVGAMESDEGWQVEGFVDDDPSVEDQALVAALGARLLGTVTDLARRRDPVHAVLAIGSPRARHAVAARLAASPVTYPALVHPAATIGLRVQLGPGTVIAPGARLSTNITVGRHVHVDQNATIGHDVVIGDFCRVNPQACVSGSVTLEDGVLVGAGAAVLQGLRVGSGAVVGASACVTRSVPADTTVKGVPAR